VFSKTHYPWTDRENKVLLVLSVLGFHFHMIWLTDQNSPLFSRKILQNLTCNDWDVSGNAVRNNLDDSCFERNCDEEEEEDDDDDDDDDDDEDDCDSPIISQEEDDEDDEDTTVFFGPMGPKQEISGI